MRRLVWTDFGILALGLAIVGCDSGGGDHTQLCTESCCAAGCCAQPATGTGAGKLPPRLPAAPGATASAPTVFAISKLYFGDSDRAGRPSTTAWKTYGLDIDGKVTAASSTDVCALAPGSSICTQLDGDDGIDNSFGANVMPVISVLNDNYDSYANDAITRGGGTLLIQLDGIGSSANYSRLTGAMYRALPTSQPLKWDGTDARDVDAVSLVGGDISKPVAVAANGYMNNRVWVSGLASGTVYLDLQVTSGNASAGLLPPIPLEHVQIAMQVASGNGSATSGVLSGVARTEDVVTWVEFWAGTVSTSLCKGSYNQSVTSEFAQMSDIMSDGTNNPGKPCDGISVGLAFDAVAVQLGKAGTEAPVVDPCKDGGTDATSNGD